MGASSFVPALILFAADLAVLGRLSLGLPHGLELHLTLVAMLVLGALASLAGLALDAAWGWRVAMVVFAGSALDLALIFLQAGPSLLFAIALGASVMGMLVSALSTDGDAASRRHWRPPSPNVKVYFPQRPLQEFEEPAGKVTIIRDDI
jgi:hypothetical protein